MPDLYPQLLLLAVVATIAALLAGLAVRFGMRRALLVQWVPLLSGIAILVLAAAAVIHLFVGHGHGSADPMDPLVFLGEHRGLGVVGALALLALGLGRDRRRQ